MKAYQRDASWFNHPDVRSIKVYHLPKDHSHFLPCCGLATLLDEDSAVDVKNVPKDLRCQRSGCKQRWKNEKT
jgi:hypothetical protein